MALILVYEDGTGKVDSNSYAQVPECDDYFDQHVYPAPWATSAADKKAEALIMATRVIDSQYQFNGWRTTTTQALQWPRQNCPDPDRRPGGVYSPLLLGGSNYIESNVVPRGVVLATFEMARELCAVDRTAAPPGEGISASWNDPSGTKYSKSDVRPIISHVAQALLSRFGALIKERSWVARLVRG